MPATPAGGPAPPLPGLLQAHLLPLAFLLLAAIPLAACSGSGGEPDLAGPVAPPVGGPDPVPLLALTDRGAAILDAATGAIDPISGAGLASAFGIESLARDPATGALFAIDRDVTSPADRGAARLVALDPVSGAAGELGFVDRNDLDALAWDADAGDLIALSGASGDLVRIAPDDATLTAIGTLPAVSTPAVGLARDPNGGTLYVFDAANAALLAVDPVTAATTTVGPTGVATIAGLVWDTSGDRLLGVSSLDGTVLELDTATGSATVVAPLVAPVTTNVRGLCFDADTGGLIANDNQRDTLATIDLVGGAWTPFGQTGLRELSGMSRRTDGTLVACERSSGAIVAIARGAEGFALLGFSGTHDLGALAVHPTDDRIFVVDVELDVLLEFDPTAGPTVIGSLGVDRVEGLSFDPTGATLFGVDRDGDTILTIDTATAATSVIATVPPGTNGVAVTWYEPLGLPYVLRESGSALVARNDMLPPAPIIGIPAGSGTRCAVFADGGDTVLLARFGIDDVLAAGVFDQSLSGTAGLGFAHARALVEDAASGALIALEDLSGRVVDVDPNTGVGTSDRSLLLGSIQGGAFDSASGVVWIWSNGLWAFAPGSGIAQQVGPSSPVVLADLAYDTTADTLFGVTAGPAPQLVVVDRVAGALTTVGTVGAAEIGALGHDALADTLVGYEPAGRTLIAIDPITAGRTVLGTAERPLRALASRYER